MIVSVGRVPCKGCALLYLGERLIHRVCGGVELVGEFLRMRVLLVSVFQAERERIEQVAGDLVYLGEPFRRLVE